MTQKEFEERLYLVRRDGETRGWVLDYWLRGYLISDKMLVWFGEGARV
jgi:hypothetical protein